MPNCCQIAIVYRSGNSEICNALVESSFIVVEYYTKEKVQEEEGSRGTELEKWANRIVGYLREKSSRKI